METQTPKPIRHYSHYYGDIVRVIFIVGAVYLLLLLPTMTETFNIPALISIFAVVILGISAGITNPVQEFSVKLNALISIVFLIIFAYLGWYSRVNNIGGWFELANQVAALLFLIASYFSVKSLRGMMVS